MTPISWLSRLPVSFQAILLALAPCPVLAGNGEPSLCADNPPDITALARRPELYNFYFENDLFNGTDSGYTNGVKFSWVSANLKDYTRDTCLPRWIRQLNRLFENLHPGKYTSRNMVVTAGQSMFTPRDPSHTDLIPGDRPYAGWLYLGLGYNARDALRMDTVEVNLGVVGPAALARQTQNFVHDLRGISSFNGWSNQLNNELGFQLVAERKNRVWNKSRPGMQFDAITHYGATAPTSTPAWSCGPATASRMISAPRRYAPPATATPRLKARSPAVLPIGGCTPLSRPMSAPSPMIFSSTATPSPAATESIKNTSWATSPAVSPGNGREGKSPTRATSAARNSKPRKTRTSSAQSRSALSIEA